MVCGNNDVTYTSVCQFNKETAKSNLTMKHWGPCEFGKALKLLIVSIFIHILQSYEDKGNYCSDEECHKRK